jgi:hypothetical protein
MAKDWCTETINPNDPGGPRISVTIPARFIGKLYTHHPVGFENLRCARHVLEKPLRIFSGIRQWNDGGGASQAGRKCGTPERMLLCRSLAIWYMRCILIHDCMFMNAGLSVRLLMTKTVRTIGRTDIED